MKGTNHVVVALSSVALIERATGFIQPHSLGLNLDSKMEGYLIAGLVVLFTALLPDIDAQHSLIRQYTYSARGILGWIAGKFIKLLVGGHRTITHYAIAWVFLTVIGLLLALQFAPGWMDIVLAGSIGYISHLLADMMTLSGVPLFGPWSKDQFHLLPSLIRFRSGSWIEYIWVAAIAGTAIISWTGLEPIREML